MKSYTLPAHLNMFFLEGDNFSGGLKSQILNKTHGVFLLNSF